MAFEAPDLRVQDNSPLGQYLPWQTAAKMEWFPGEQDRPCRLEDQFFPNGYYMATGGGYMIWVPNVDPDDPLPDDPSPVLDPDIVPEEDQDNSERYDDDLNS